MRLLLIALALSAPATAQEWTHHYLFEPPPALAIAALWGLPDPPVARVSSRELPISGCCRPFEQEPGWPPVERWTRIRVVYDPLTGAGSVELAPSMPPQPPRWYDCEKELGISE